MSVITLSVVSLLVSLVALFIFFIKYFDYKMAEFRKQRDEDFQRLLDSLGESSKKTETLYQGIKARSKDANDPRI